MLRVQSLNYKWKNATKLCGVLQLQKNFNVTISAKEIPSFKTKYFNLEKNVSKMQTVLFSNI